MLLRGKQPFLWVTPAEQTALILRGSSRPDFYRGNTLLHPALPWGVPSKGAPGNKLFSLMHLCYTTCPAGCFVSLLQCQTSVVKRWTASSCWQLSLLQGVELKTVFPPLIGFLNGVWQSWSLNPFNVLGKNSGFGSLGQKEKLNGISTAF